MTEEKDCKKCKFYNQCKVDCEGLLENTKTCECYRLYSFIEYLISAINQGTKNFKYEEAPFLHEAMEKYLTFYTGLDMEDLL